MTQNQETKSSQNPSGLWRRHCEFSSDLFGGFGTDLDISSVTSLDEIIAMVVSSLFEVLEIHKFRELIRDARKRSFHIHNYTLDQLRTNTDTIWICDHDLV